MDVRGKTGMKQDTVTAAKLLYERQASFVLCKGKTTVIETEAGLGPLFSVLKKGENFSGFCAADKIVGKAAAFLYVRLGVREVYAPIMSDAGIYTLARHGIYPVCEKSVSSILNQDRTDICPIEKLVSNVNDTEQAVSILIDRLFEAASERRCKNEKNSLNSSGGSAGVSSVCL